MKLLTNNRSHKTLALIGFIGLWVGLALPARGAEAGKKMPAPESSPQIHVTAERLLFRQNERFAEFQGNVEAAQGNTTIRSDALRIRYKEDATAPTGEKTKEDPIDQIVATGNVSILFENQTAFCDRAVYNPDSGVLVLTGKKVRIESKGNFINGEQVMMNRKTGEITVIGGSGNRVEAMFESEAADRTETTGAGDPGDASGR